MTALFAVRRTSVIGKRPNPTLCEDLIVDGLDFQVRGYSTAGSLR